MFTKSMTPPPSAASAWLGVPSFKDDLLAQLIEHERAEAAGRENAGMSRLAINRLGSQRAAGALHSKLRSSSVPPWPR